MKTEILEEPISRYICQFISNENERCVFFDLNGGEAKNDEKSCSKLKYKKGNQMHGSCALQIDSNVADIVGKWQIRTYFWRNNVVEEHRLIYNFELHLKTVIYFSIITVLREFNFFLLRIKNVYIILQEVHTVSKLSSIPVYSGQYVYVELEGTYPKDVSCNLEVGKLNVSIYYIKSNHIVTSVIKLLLMQNCL